VLASAPRGSGKQKDVSELRTLARDIDRGSTDAYHQWIERREATLQRYGYASYLTDEACVGIDQRLEAEATQWAKQFSPWSMACLRQAATDFNIENDIYSGNIDTSLLWMNCTSDVLFPCNFAALEPTARRVAVHCVSGKYGHMSPVLESELWTSHL